MKAILCSVAAVALLAALTPSASARDYRGAYWYEKYFGPVDDRPHHGRRERDALPRAELSEEAFDQGFYNVHHLLHAADKPEIYALAREAGLDREVAIVIDAENGDVIEAVLLPY